MHTTTNFKVTPSYGTAHTPCVQFKRFPAFGKQMMDLRLTGLVPPNSVAVSFDWKLGRAFPRVVIADPVPSDTLELRYLAGLDVMIVYCANDASRVMELAHAILRVNPRSLLAFAMDIPKNIILKSLTGEVMI